MPNKQRLLELALKGLEADRAKIDDEIAQIKVQLNHQAPPSGPESLQKTSYATATTLHHAPLH